MNYDLFVLPSAERDLDRLEKLVYQRCEKCILSLRENPRPHGVQKLAGDDGFRVRVGDFRILYRVDDEQKRVYLYRVKHRKDVYR